MSIDLEQLRTDRGQIANDRAWREPRRLLEDLEPELAELRGERAVLENPPASVKSTADRILREWNPSPTDPKGLATAVRELRSAAIGALQLIFDKPAEIAALLEEIETVIRQPLRVPARPCSPLSIVDGSRRYLATPRALRPSLMSCCARSKTRLRWQSSI